MLVSSRTIEQISSEPYRLFFPMALVSGVLGVLLWPLFYANGVDWMPAIIQLPFYPNLAHAHLMIEGFVGGFAIGFTGTALPKMLSAAPLRPSQIATLLGLYLSFCSCHLLGHVRTGDALFAAMMLLMLSFLLLRVFKAKAVPPPGMALAGMGLLSGTLGAAWMAAFGFDGDIQHYVFAQRLLYQVYILLPLLGIGCHIFPMILGAPNQHGKLTGSKISRAWKSKASEAALLGILLILTYWVEAISRSADRTSAMSAVRLLLCFVWLTKESGWLKRPNAKGLMAFALRAGIVCLLGGMLATSITLDILQHRKIALDHSLYIGGFGLITLMVASRVIYGHSGQGKQFQLWSKPLCWTTGLLIFTMLTRVTADFIPRVVISHHVYAALLWVIVSLVWGIALLPSVKKQPPPKALKSPKSPISDNKPSLMSMDFRK